MVSGLFYHWHLQGQAGFTITPLGSCAISFTAVNTGGFHLWVFEPGLPLSPTPCASAAVTNTTSYNSVFPSFATDFPQFSGGTVPLFTGGQVENPTHVFSGPGTFQVSHYYGTSSTGPGASFTMSVVVSSNMYDSGFIYEIVYSGCPPNAVATVSFIPKIVLGDDPCESKPSWTFQNGSPSAASTAFPSVQWNQEGCFTVTHTLSGGCALPSSTSNLVCIDFPDPIVPSFTWSATPYCLGYTFQASPIVPGATYLWDFGDGYTSTQSNSFIHTFPAGGTFPVSLSIVSAGGCETSISNNVTVDGECLIDFPCPCENNGLNIGRANTVTPSSSFGFTFFPIRCLAVAGTLDITEVKIALGSSFKMQPNSKIRVLSGVSFASSSNTSFVGCDTMWEGIEVLSNSTFTVSKSRIEDAIKGISLTQGSNIRCSTTMFDKNHVGIYMDGTPIFTGSFEGNAFDCSQTLLPHYSNEYGLCALQVLGASTTLGSINRPPNTIAGLRNGILVGRSIYSMDNFKISNLKGYGDGIDVSSNSSVSGIGVVANRNLSVTMTNTSIITPFIGLRSERSNLLIVSNVVEVSQSGIAISGSGGREIDILRNEISIVDDGLAVEPKGIKIETSPSIARLVGRGNTINLNGPGVGYNGIEIESSYPANTINGIISENTINVFTIKSAGVEIRSSPRWQITENNLFSSDFRENGGIDVLYSPTVKVRFNNVVNFVSGIQLTQSIISNIECNNIYGNPFSTNGLRFRLPSNGTEVSGNLLENHGSGLIYDNMAITKVHVNAGNKWVGNTVGAAHGGIFSIYNLSKYYTNPFTPYLPISISPSQWFSYSYNPEYGCDIFSNEPSDMDGKFTSVDTSTVKKEFADLEFGASLQWMLELNLQEKLDLMATVPSGVFEDFVVDNSTSEIGKIKNAVGLIHHAFALTEVEQQEQEGQLLNASEFTESINTNLQATIGASVQDSILLFSQNVELLNLLTESNDKWQSVQLEYNNRTQVATNLALAEIEGEFIPKPADGLQTYLNASFKKLQGSSLTAEEQNSILHLALQCPFEYGSAVYLAQAFAKSLGYHISENDACALENRESKEGLRSKDVNKYHLFPNPAKDMVSIQLGDAPCFISIFDSYGRRLRNLGHKSHFTTFSVRELKAGTYFLQIKEETGVVIVLPFIVLP